ncbi:2-hydroxychromene-2-carboxylate isomerase/DsbA-like thioredoxin domain [Paramagnetospirillum magnetotacticum MS-1]|uniref:2-hydroxychromene-2-carboxylate isomerase/DsbA-like thioredoxin domain n=1 Tax=Paramagnetospirillum magnetotacticum MS-1 TaxID=272627 RepID=A0A0C2YVY3_PARME|nr:DsbA family oxidoreductase [Paramagnetospirillum magnetotacticum]KIL98870.1 2-hydroxychromene-2-carboxylate isomerase/DsbA-like thioredoxin domain [Paramagnetospirillum magnetotacticum MS-1]
MRIEYVFDTVCPWCYVGKRRLERALAQRPETRARIIWRPFLLNPDLPAEGIDRRTYLDRKFGGTARVQRVHAAVAAAGKSEGIDFDFDSITRMPNSLNSHRMIRYAGASGCEAELVESLYRAYFVQGLDIGDVEVLTAIGASVGLAPDPLRTYLSSDADAVGVLNDNARAHRLGVNGVPCLILDGSYALAGAQEPDILLRLIDIVRESQPEAAFS